MASLEHKTNYDRTAKRRGGKSTESVRQAEAMEIGEVDACYHTLKVYQARNQGTKTMIIDPV